MSDEEKEDKPKKAFQIKIVVWDDGEVDADIREYRKLGTGRGAPSLCGPLSAKDLTKALKNLMINPVGVRDSIAVELGIESDESVSYDKEDTESATKVSELIQEEDDDLEDSLPDPSDMDVPDFSDLEVD